MAGTEEPVNSAWPCQVLTWLDPLLLAWLLWRWWLRLAPCWRRGLWHTVLHGEKRQNRRMQWFQPVYVGLS